MDPRRNLSLLVYFLLLAVSIGCGPSLAERFVRLPDADQELYARSKQFMTDRQQEAFLNLPNGEARAGFVKDLKIPERLSKFPPHEQEAILGGRVVPGMGSEAVLLSWGRPERIERRGKDGMELACWIFQRPGPDHRVVTTRVHFLEGRVEDVVFERD